MRPFLKTLSEGRSLTEAEAASAMRKIMAGEAEPEETAAFLLGVRSRGETLDELVGFTRVMRENAVRVDVDDPAAIDLCGTGGDHSGSFNISTAVSFVCAGAGATVAKHGNRSVSSRSGSADVLEALGVRTELRKEAVEDCLRRAGIAFLFAPYFHPAMRHVMPVRKKLGVRTFFNVLGPLVNPAGVRRQLVGAFDAATALQMAQVLHRLGADHAITVHGEDGLDEISLAGASTIFHARSNMREVKAERVEPEQLGLKRATADTLLGGSAEDNAAIIRRILRGEVGPPRDVVLLNAAFALQASGRHASLEACIQAAAACIDSGAAREKLEALVDVSNSLEDA